MNFMLSTLFLLNHGPQQWEYVYVKFHNSASEILSPLIYLLGGFKSSLKMKFEKFNAHIMPALADNKTINPCPLFFLTLVF